MSGDLQPQIEARALASGISENAARLLLTGALAIEAPAVTPVADAVSERAGRTTISTAAAELLLAPTAQRLGLLPRPAESSQQ